MKQYIKALACVACLGWLATANLYAADTIIKTFSLAASIGSHVSLTILNLDPNNSKSLFADVTDTDFTNGYVTTSNGVQLRSVSSNKPVLLKIKNTGWTLPAQYDATNGPRKTDGSDGTLLIKVNSSTLTAAAGQISIDGSYGSDFVAVTNTAASFLKLGQVTPDSKKQGVKEGSADIDVKVLLDPVYDIPGNYSVTLELSIQDL